MNGKSIARRCALSKVKWLVSFVTVLFVFRLDVFAVGSGGIANEVTSAEDLANLTAIVGSKTDPTIGYHNPASITDQGKYNASLGVSYFNFSAKRSGSNGTSDTMNTENIFVPNFGAVYGFGGGKWAAGLAVVSPYGLSTEWSDSSNVRYVATKSTLEMYDATPSIAYRFSDKASVGVGADYFSTFNADLEHKVPVDVLNAGLLSPTSGSPDANAKLSGDGNAWGYHAGVIFHLTPSHTFGLAYHSEVKTKIEGDLEITGLSGASASPFGFGGQNFKTHARTDLFYPQNVQFGYKYSQGDKWEAGFNLAWYDWSSNKQLEIVLPDATPTQRALAGNPIPLHWRDVWSGTIGGFYRFNEAWKLNMGAYYLPRVYQEGTFSPAVPDMDKIGISVGPSYTHGNWAVDTVYNPLFYKSTTINNQVGQNANGGQAFADISGKYKAFVQIVGVNVRYKYGGETN